MKLALALFCIIATLGGAIVSFVGMTLFAFGAIHQGHTLGVAYLVVLIVTVFGSAGCKSLSKSL